MKYKLGDLIKFAEEKGPYRICARNSRYLICTKPYNPLRTVIYTIVDLKAKTRGTENLIFGAGAETDRHCNLMLKRIVSGKTDISHRNRIPLRIQKLAKPKN